MLDGNAKRIKEEFHHHFIAIVIHPSSLSLPESPTGASSAIGAMSSSLSDSNSSERAWVGWRLRFLAVAPSSSCALLRASSHFHSNSGFAARSFFT
jgi:hypothetical protein